MAAHQIRWLMFILYLVDQYIFSLGLFLDSSLSLV